ncbi:prepilin-type N-terminal cleavage/methylation domain-containing protein [Pseudomonas syringae]|nr:prepilin-type N-terminal cleavage/methylation domain-containing protein [Pseudomonas syringae]
MCESRADLARYQRGFTLLEMLAALTLMAICSTAVLVAFGQSVHSLSQAEQSDRLTEAAMSVMDQEAAGQSGWRYQLATERRPATDTSRPTAPVSPRPDGNRRPASGAFQYLETASGD